MTISWRRRKSNTMSTHHHHLPEDIIDGILVRLPLKSIIRFQCVCKSWFNLIKNSPLICNRLIKSDVSFIALCFIHRSKQFDSWFLNVFLYDDDYEEEISAKRLTRFRKGVRRWIDVLCDSQKPDPKNPLPVLNFELPFSCQHSDFRSRLELVGHCNGVMCLTDYDFILLVNPLLKEVKTVSNPIKPSLVGLGFDDMTKDFKVVRLFICNGMDDSRQLQAEVYNLRTNAWRELGVFPYGFYDRIKCSAFFNGVIHWCVEVNKRRWRILTFNLATELFQLMEFPQGWHGSHENTPPRIGLFVFKQDSLAFVDYSSFVSSPTVNVWIMKNKHVTGKTAWTCIYSIRHVPQLGKLISCWKKNELLFETKSGKLVLYDLLKHSWSAVFDSSQISRHNANSYSQLCLEAEAGLLCGSSLVSMNM